MNGEWRIGKRRQDAGAPGFKPVSRSEGNWRISGNHRAPRTAQPGQLRRLERYPGLDRPNDPDLELVPGHLQVVVRLQVEPPFGPGPEIAG